MAVIHLLGNDDYPEWVVDLERGTKEIEESELWRLAREFEDPPHIGNLYIQQVFENVGDYIFEYTEKRIPGIDTFPYVERYVNAMASSLEVYGRDVKTMDEVREAVDAFIDAYLGEKAQELVAEMTYPELKAKVLALLTEDE